MWLPTHHTLTAPADQVPGCLAVGLPEGGVEVSPGPHLPPSLHIGTLIAPPLQGAILHPAWAQLQPTGQCSWEPDGTSGQMPLPDRRRGLRRSAQLSPPQGPQRKPSQRLCSSSEVPLVQGAWSSPCWVVVGGSVLCQGVASQVPDLGAAWPPASLGHRAETWRHRGRHGECGRKGEAGAGSPCHQRQGGAGTDSRLLSQEAGLLGCPLDTP